MNIHIASSLVAPFFEACMKILSFCSFEPIKNFNFGKDYLRFKTHSEPRVQNLCNNLPNILPSSNDFTRAEDFLPFLMTRLQEKGRRKVFPGNHPLS